MADIKKYIDVEYLRSFWNHIKSIPEQVDYLLNGKEQTIQEAIDELGKDKQDKLEPGFGIEIDKDNVITSEVEYKAGNPYDYRYEPIQVTGPSLKINGRVYNIYGINYYNGSNSKHYVWDKTHWVVNDSNIYDYIFVKNGKYYNFSYYERTLGFVGLGVYNEQTQQYEKLDLKYADGSEVLFEDQYGNLNIRSIRMFEYDGTCFISWSTSSYRDRNRLYEIDLETGTLTLASNFYRNLHCQNVYLDKLNFTNALFEDVWSPSPDVVIVECYDLIYSITRLYRLNISTNEWEELWYGFSIENIVEYQGEYYIYGAPYINPNLSPTSSFYKYNPETVDWEVCTDVPNYVKPYNIYYWQANGVTYYLNESYDPYTDSWTYTDWPDPSYTGISDYNSFRIGNFTFHKSSDNKIYRFDTNPYRLTPVGVEFHEEGFYPSDIVVSSITYLGDATYVMTDDDCRDIFSMTYDADANVVSCDRLDYNICLSMTEYGSTYNIYPSKYNIWYYNNNAYYPYNEYDNVNDKNIPVIYKWNTTSKTWDRHVLTLADGITYVYLNWESFFIIGDEPYINGNSWYDCHLDFENYVVTRNEYASAWSDLEISPWELYEYNSNTYYHNLMYNKDTHTWDEVVNGVDDFSSNVFKLGGKYFVTKDRLYELVQADYDYITNHGDKLQIKLKAGAGIYINGNTISADVDMPDVPTKTSELNNDAKFVNETQLATKQDILNAGYGIEIDDNTIDSEVEYIHQIVEWKEQTWDGYTNNLYGKCIWTDNNDVIHYDNWNDHYYLDANDNTWKQQTWSGLNIFQGAYMWSDYNGVIHYDFDFDHYYLDPNNKTWIAQTWNGYTGLIDGNSIWKDNNGVIHYDYNNNHYYLDSDGITWISQTWNEYTSIDGQYIWTDNNRVIHYDEGRNHYYLDSDGVTWKSDTWNDLNQFDGYQIWKDNNGVIHFDYDNDHYYLDSDNKTWIEQTWSGLNAFRGEYIWRDYNGVIHFDFESGYYYLQEEKKGYFTKHNDELQTKLKAGEGIKVSPSGVISATVDISTKQDKLTAGYGIEIQNDSTIDSEVEYNRISDRWVPYQYIYDNDRFSHVVFSGRSFWRDYNGVIHLDSWIGNDDYNGILLEDNKTIIPFEWKGDANHIGAIWVDNNGIIHADCSVSRTHKILLEDNETWQTYTWKGNWVNGFSPLDLWRDYDNNLRINTYNGSRIIRADGTWEIINMTNPDNIYIYNEYIWTDYNGLIHYDSDDNHYYLKPDNVTWDRYDWGEAIVNNAISRYHLWTDKNGILFEGDEYYLDKATNKWVENDLWEWDNNAISFSVPYVDYAGNFITVNGLKYSHIFTEGENQYLTRHDDELQTKLTAGKNISIKDGVISATASVELGSGHEQAAPGDHTHNEFEIMQNQITALSLGLKLTLSVSPGNGPKGESQSYKWTAKFEGADPDSITIYDENGDVFVNQDNTVADTPLTSINKSITKTLTSKLTYTAKARYMGMTFQASAATTPYYRILYGFCTGDAHPVTKFGTVRTTAVGAKLDGTATANGQVFKIYIPEGVTPPTGFSMGGAPATYNKGTNVTVNGVVYTPYVSGAVYNNGASVSITMS